MVTPSGCGPEEAGSIPVVRPMKLWKVTLAETRLWDLRVEAETEADARKKALDGDAVSEDPIERSEESIVIDVEPAR